MCLSVEEWKFINSFAPWLSAIGTLLAVCVSLYISFSTRKITLSISSGIFVFNENGADEEYLAIYVTNTGYRTVFLNSLMCISFQVGLFKKTNIGIGHKYINSHRSSSFPCKLGENETANLFLKINNSNTNWLQNLKKEHLKTHSLSTLRIVVYPNVGKPFKVKPDKTIMKEIISS
ncbi:MAG: hypothetical protein WCP01_12085 [Methylococcaceae bacterium]